MFLCREAKHFLVTPVNSVIRDELQHSFSSGNTSCSRTCDNIKLTLKIAIAHFKEVNLLEFENSNNRSLATDPLFMIHGQSDVTEIYDNDPSRVCH